MVVLGVVLVVPFVFDHEFQLGLLAGVDHREQPQPPLEQEYILVRPGPAAFFLGWRESGRQTGLCRRDTGSPRGAPARGLSVFLPVREGQPGKGLRGHLLPRPRAGPGRTAKRTRRGKAWPSPAFCRFLYHTICKVKSEERRAQRAEPCPTHFFLYMV